MNYDYPLNETWSLEAVLDVIAFYNAVEAAYEKGCASSELLTKYIAFKEIVTTKSEEKQIDAAFKSLSGYSIYDIIAQAKKVSFVKGL